MIDGTDVFTADVLFKGTVGGTMAPGASGFEDLKASVMRLMELPPETRVHPGHREPTTIGEQFSDNPFVRIWRGIDATGEEEVTVWDRPATMKLWAPDYDGGNKAWIVFGDSGEEAIVGGSQVVRGTERNRPRSTRFFSPRGPIWTHIRCGRDRVSPQFGSVESIQEWFFNWYPVFGVFFMAVLLLVFMRMMRMTVGSTKPETVKASKGKPVAWDEVQGVDAAKDELMDVAEWLREPDRFKALGAAPPRGVLLYGPPGTGKTMLARAVAAQANCDFYAASGSSFVEMFVGRGAARIRRLFKEARKSGRAVIFIDEIDAVGGHRSGGGGDGGTSEREQALNQLLVELDGFEKEQRDGDRDRRLQQRRKARQGAAAAGSLRPPGAGRAARPRRPRGDPPRPRRRQAAGR